MTERGIMKSNKALAYAVVGTASALLTLLTLNAKTDTPTQTPEVRYITVVSETSAPVETPEAEPSLVPSPIRSYVPPKPQSPDPQNPDNGGNVGGGGGFIPPQGFHPPSKKP